MSSGPSGESKKGIRNTEIFWINFEMQMIVDWFRGGWYKLIMEMFVGQRITVMFGDSVT